MELKLPRDFLDRVFPFHAYFDARDRLVALGPSLSKLLPHLQLGMDFAELFKITAPDPSVESPRDFCDQSLYLLRDRVSNIGLKAQCVEIEPAAAHNPGPDQLLGCGESLLLLNPRVQELESLNEIGLKLTDFPSHDSFTDYLVALQTQKLALSDASAMAQRLLESNASLEQRENMLSSLIKNIPRGGVLVVDRQFNALFADGSELPFDRVGTSDEPVALHELIDDQDACAELKRGIQRVMDGFTTKPFQVTLTNKTFSCAGEPFTSADNQAFLIVLSDITDSKLGEEQRIRTQRLEALGVLAGGLAHDFNNLLTAVIGNLSLIEADNQTAPQRDQAVQDAMTACRRATELTAQLLTFAKGGAPRRELSDISDIINESISLSLRGTGVSYEIDVPDSLPRVLVDNGQLVQVFNNLLINAAQAMDQAGQIQVRVQHDNQSRREEESGLEAENWLRIDVKDNGPGINAQDRARLFDPYFTTKPDGHGLGLAVCFSIVERHGGFIRVASEVGAGTTFSVHLPADTATGSNVLRLPGSTERIVPCADHHNVLIMDDESSLRTLLSRMLGQLGHQVTACATGEEALAEFTKAKDLGAPFTHVILDLTIRGGMGGIEATEQLQRLQCDAQLILTSGYSNELGNLDQNKLGFAAVLKKPFTMTQLEAALERTAERQLRDVPAVG